MNKKLQIGTVVYLEPTGNAVRYNKEIIKTTVTKVGNKYFEVEAKSGKFDLIRMIQVSNYCSDWNVYLSEQEIKDKREIEKIKKELREMFGAYGAIELSLNQLREIQKIATIKT